ncbi:MAG: CmcJ/NvfI family oxidoreductase, partial [Stellaceae bacterium]
MDTIEPDLAPASIEAELSYYAGDGSMPVSLVAEPGGRDARIGATGSQTHRVTLHNGRPAADRFQLDRDGFRFVRHDTQIADFYDDDAIARAYYPEMEALVKQESGARRVVVFDHTLRTEDPSLRETRKIREVVRRVHNDYTELSAPKRVRDLMGDEAETLLQGRFAIIQVWR